MKCKVMLMHQQDHVVPNMSEASSFSIDIAKMRNALLSSVSSRLHCYGDDDEAQFEILEGSMQMNDQTNRISLSRNFLSNGFNMESRILNNDSQLIEGVNAEPCQSQSQSYDYNHHQGSLYGIPRFKDIYQHSLLLDKDPSSQYGVRLCLLVPMRRNPKLSDKVTTLQKLTDTASVLHEASLYIKLLQAQIRVSHQECGDKLQVDLRSRGLCLVPVSMTEKVTMDDQIYQATSSGIIHS
ncbi:unnamed protein product [Sphenostylis stenocarpa]|uniref:BHLH domain-containing protein n=1 Tax=Sphenostylis stenocarpa TaxID=92480 RepID=A0AA86RVG9_9FABA|nr:unnamed protein product [Sphenostylis stenocarpa]